MLKAHGMLPVKVQETQQKYSVLIENVFKKANAEKGMKKAEGNKQI